MYPNLRAEMARNKITQGDLSEALGWAPSTASLKVNGKAPITLDEAKVIKAIVKTNLPIEELFEEEAV